MLIFNFIFKSLYFNSHLSSTLSPSVPLSHCCPRGAHYNPAGKLGPTQIINKLFKNGKTGPDDHTILHHSVEEGLVRLFANQAADVENGGVGAFDLTLPVHTAAAMFASQTHRLIAYHAIRGSAQAALRSLVRSTRFN